MLDTSPPSGQLEVASDAECVRLLRSNDIGRIALVDGEAHPIIFPVNYFFDEGVVVCRTAPGAKLDLSPETYVSFEIDGWDPATGVGWSVLVRGIAHDITRHQGMPAERIRSWPVRPVAPGSRPNWIGIWANEITGRKFQTEPYRLTA